MWWEWQKSGNGMLAGSCSEGVCFPRNLAEVATLDMLTSAEAGVLSCRLFGGDRRGHEAVQLLAMSRTNQPLIKLVLHKHLELLPLLPKISI